MHKNAFILLPIGVAIAAACNTATLDVPAGLPPDPTNLPPYGGWEDAASSSGGGDSGGTTDGASSSSGDAKAPADAGLAYTSAVSVIVEPDNNDKGQALVDAINGAKTSVHMTMYLLSSSSVITALIAQKKKGLDVKVLLNQTFPQGQGSNTSAYNQLQSGGVDVKWAPAGYQYTHEKCIILDAATAWIMTMNATQTSPTDNREYLAVDTDANDVATAETVFEADWANTSENAGGKLIVAPLNAKDRLSAFLGTATSSIDLEAEELSDTQITSALVARAQAGVKVRIVLSNATPTPAQQTAVTTLKGASIPLVQVVTPYIHAKAAVVDGAHAYVGSANFTSGSMTSNRELGVLIDGTAGGTAKTGVDAVAKTIGTDFAAGTPL